MDDFCGLQLHHRLPSALLLQRILVRRRAFGSFPAWTTNLTTASGAQTAQGRRWEPAGRQAAMGLRRSVHGGRTWLPVVHEAANWGICWVLDTTFSRW